MTHARLPRFVVTVKAHAKPFADEWGRTRFDCSRKRSTSRTAGGPREDPTTRFFDRDPEHSRRIKFRDVIAPSDRCLYMRYIVEREREREIRDYKVLTKKEENFNLLKDEDL